MKKFKKNPGAKAPAYKKTILINSNQQTRIKSLVEVHTQANARAAAAQREATMANDSLNFLFATIIECSGGDPKASYNLVADGTRLEAQ